MAKKSFFGPLAEAFKEPEEESSEDMIRIRGCCYIEIEDGG